MDLESIEKNRDILIKNWFNTLLSGKINETILLLFGANTETIKKIKKSARFENISLQIIYNLRDITCNLSLSNKNTILNISREDFTNENYSKNLYYLMSSNRFLFVHEQNDFFKKYDYFKREQYFSEMEITDKNEDMYYIGKSDPFSILQRYNESELKDLFKFHLPFGLASLLDFGDHRLFDKTSIQFFHNHENLYRDIEMLKQDKILTSRLAVVFYRIFKDINASTTAIGRYFHKEIGYKSKTYKTNSLRVIPKDFIYKEAFKAYDLNVDEREKLLKTKIAKNLITLEIEQLNAENIAKATELPLQEVEKLMNK